MLRSHLKDHPTNKQLFFVGRRFRMEHWRNGNKIATLIEQNNYIYVTPEEVMQVINNPLLSQLSGPHGCVVFVTYHLCNARNHVPLLRYTSQTRSTWLSYRKHIALLTCLFGDVLFLDYLSCFSNITYTSHVTNCHLEIS